MLMLTCRVCSASTLVEFLDLGDQPHGDSFLESAELSLEEPFYPLRANFCTACTTVQIDYTVPKELMFEHYLYVSGTTRTLSRHFEESANRLTQKYHLESNDLVVDIGSNDGTWLQFFKNNDLKILGIDGAKNIASIANAKGIETWPVFFNREIAQKVVSAKGKAKLVTAAGVFFHLEELHSVNAGITELLSEDGVFCIQAIYLGEMIRNNKFDQIYHEHLTYWTLTSISKLLELHGLEIFDVRDLEIHGGSLEIHACHRGQRPIQDSVRELKYLECQLGYQKIETYLEFGLRVWKIRDKLMEILQTYKTNKMSVYAMGAPIKGATLLNSFNIKSDLVQCAVEINELKIGKYVPGARIPIVGEDSVSPPDAYLLLAWNFLPELINKYLDYINSGGAFILPVPDPKIIDKSNLHEYIAEGGER
jgi:hypothetical protein